MVLLVLGLCLASTDALERWDRFIYDYLTSWSTRPAPENIVIIAIDEQSLQHYGSWPWPRSVHADLIDKLSIGGARVIGFDIVIAEPGNREPGEDRLLADALGRSGRVILPVLAEMDHSERLRLTRPLSILEQGAEGLGHVGFELDTDGIMRRVFLMAGLGRPEWQSLSLAMLTFTQPAQGNNLPGRRNRNLANASAENWVRDHEVLIPFAGGPGHFQRISYAAFMDPSFDPGAVEDKYVLVGATALGMGDALPTPVSGESVPMPGVEINANLLAALQQHVLIEPIGRSERLILTLLLIIFPLFLYPFIHQKAVPFMVAGSVTMVLLVSVVWMRWQQSWYPPASPLFAIVLSYPLWAGERLEKLVRRLIRERKRALVTLHSIGEGVITTDNDGIVLYLNPAAERITGFRTEEAREKGLKEILPVYDEDIGRDQTVLVEECLRKGEIVHLEEEAVFTDRVGKEHAVRISAGPIHDHVGRTLGAVLGISDVTEKRQALRELSYQSTHDLLTGLPNRTLLRDRLQQAISHARRTGTLIGVLFLDLDNFKKVNDQLGHAGGDRLLVAVGHRLAGCVSEGDTVARPGGDEFVVLLEGLSGTGSAAARAEKIKQQLGPPFHFDGHEIFVSASMGISVFPKDGNQGDMLLKNADIAMYEVKRRGRDRYLFFAAEMNELLQQRLRLEEQLRTALRRNELELYYQPQVRLWDNRIVGVEALMRWHSNHLGVVSPELFIPVAEESGLILELSEWALVTACRQGRIWQENALSPPWVGVNLSPRHFLEDDLPDQLRRIIHDTGIDPKNFDLEITEGLLMQDVDRSIEVLQEFKNLGGTISIDDFGTGYSSLAYLKQFPIDKLKIDRSFVRDVHRDSKDEGLARTIITMGHGLGLQVVAEGVEKSEQLAIMRAQGCDIVQGYYFYQPMRGDGVTNLLQTSTSRSPRRNKSS